MEPRTAPSGRARSVSLALAAVLVLTLGIGLTACDSGDKKAKKPTSGATPPVTAPAPTSRMKVNLAITGAFPATIQGTSGTCTFPASGMPNTYALVAANYPQLGALGSVRVWGTTVLPAQEPLPPTVKVFINSVGFISAFANHGITVSSDGRRVDIDTELYGAPGGSAAGSLLDPTWTLQGHIKGSITCPE